MKLHRAFKSFLAAATAAIALASAPSHAVVISATTNNPYAFNWSFDTSTAAGLLTGNGSLTLSGFNSNALTVNVTLNNTSTLASNRLTAFGFGIDPNATSVTFFDGADGGIIASGLPGNTNIGGGIHIEVCAWGGNSCQGGSNGGIVGGASDSFSMILGGTWGSEVNIDPIAFKYQTGSGSFHFTPGGTPVPEPGSIFLLGIGLLGLFAGIRSRRA